MMVVEPEEVVVVQEVSSPAPGVLPRRHEVLCERALSFILTDLGVERIRRLRYRQTRFSSRRQRRRVVLKHGDCNVIQGKVAKRRRRYLQDIFTTLVDAQWRWTLLVFALNFLLSWLGFAIVWWLILFNHGDLEAVRDTNQTWVPCVRDVNSFTGCFLFSVETQHTIGYGAKHTTDECWEAIFTMCLQSLVGVMIQAFMVGIVFAKLSRPKKRTQTLLFSRNAVINQRDGQLCLMFRVGDMRKSHIIEAHVRAQLISKRITKEGEILPFYQHELKVGGDGEEDKIFFIWPTTIVHKITCDSPLYTLSAAEMMRQRFEIVVILEGVIESTGMTTQARSSYLPGEILWGHRFEPLVAFKKETGEHEVDYSLFNNTYEVDTPLCSAHSLDQLIMGVTPTPPNNGSTAARRWGSGGGRAARRRGVRSEPMSEREALRPGLRKASTPVNFRFFEDTDNESADFNLCRPHAKIQIAGLDNTSLHRGKSRSSNRSATRKLRRRAVLKNGDCNVSQVHISKRRRRYLQDIFTTLVDIQWRWTLLVFALSFLLSWLVFAAIWWLISFTHGDLDDHDESWTPCVVNINSFTSCFLFSIETQHTIGYGSRSTTEECPEAIFVMCLQSITGVFIQAFMVGIVFAKMARPKQRTQTLLFSRNAVIAMRDGLLCLMFRVGDMREKSHLIGSSVRAQLVRPHTTKEGEVLSPFLYDLKVKADNYDADVFLIWPTVIVHEIDATSPLYELGAADMINERFEIVVILEGTTESTGQTTQARTSYVASEILWGHRFQPLVAFNRAKGTYQVNFGLFHNTYQVDTPLCSARDLETFLEGTDIEL